MTGTGWAALLLGISFVLSSVCEAAAVGAGPLRTFWGGARTVACVVLPCQEPCELGDDVVGGRVEPEAVVPLIPVRKKEWEAALGGEEAARPYVAARLAALPTGQPGRPLPAGDEALTRQLAEDTWRGLEALVDREHQLPVDHVHLVDGPAGAQVGDYTNVTTVGLRMIAIVAAHELGLVTRAEALARLRAVLDTLGRLETTHGFFYNYYDTTSLERTSNLVSFVDSSWLTASLVVVRNALPELAADATRLIEAGDYGFFYDTDLGRMAHGWWAHRKTLSRYHYGVLWAESRLGSLLAIGKGDVPEEHWYRMARTFPASCDWQTQPPVNRRRKTVRGHEIRGGWYEWAGERFVPSWGGSMFEALMPTLVLDEARLAPESLGANGAVHARVQRRFAQETLGWPVWGLSPSLTPGTNAYAEYGARPLGVLGYGAGVVTPHAAALALAYEPAAAIANLRRLAAGWPVYGEFGFYDAVDPVAGTVARSYLTLDQAMIFIAAANHLTDGAVRRYFAADAIVARVVPLLAAERFFD